MSDLISRSALDNFFYSETSGTDEIIEDAVMKYSEMEMEFSDDCRALCKDIIEMCRNVIRTEPTVEAKPAIHGKWEENIEHTSEGNYLIGWMCSNCLCDIDTDNLYDSKPNYDFCPHCGCDMRGKTE